MFKATNQSQTSDFGLFYVQGTVYRYIYRLAMYGGYSISTQLIRPIFSKIPGLMPTERNMPSSAKQNNPQLWGKHHPKLNRPLKLRWECVSAMKGEKFFQSWTDHAMITAFPDNISNSRSHPSFVEQVMLKRYLKHLQLYFCRSSGHGFWNGN